LAELAGTGIELTSVPRLRRLHERFGDRLLERLFTPAEVDYARRKRDGIPNLAARFAAKTAARRALRPLVAAPIPFSDLEIVRRTTGEPTLELRGRTAARLARAPLHIAVSLTHEAGFGLASVWIERGDARSPAAVATG
jgi:holo-[acyl-carrier protein] synthase